MNAEHSPRGIFEEGNEQAVGITVATDIARLKDVFRQQHDPRLLAVVRGFDDVLATRLPEYHRERVENEQRSHTTPQVDERETESLHWFGYQENGHSWLLAVGPTRS